MPMQQGKRITIYVDNAAFYDLEYLCHLIGKERNKHCSKSEIVNIALIAFLNDIHEQRKSKSNNN